VQVQFRNRFMLLHGSKISLFYICSIVWLIYCIIPNIENHYITVNRQLDSTRMSNYLHLSCIDFCTVDISKLFIWFRYIHSIHQIRSFIDYHYQKYMTKFNLITIHYDSDWTEILSPDCKILALHSTDVYGNE